MPFHSPYAIEISSMWVSWQQHIRNQSTHLSVAARRQHQMIESVDMQVTRHTPTSGHVAEFLRCSARRVSFVMRGSQSCIQETFDWFGKMTETGMRLIEQTRSTYISNWNEICERWAHHHCLLCQSLMAIFCAWPHLTRAPILLLENGPGIILRSISGRDQASERQSNIS